MIKYKILPDGSFVVGDTSTGVTEYAYPNSPYAILAKDDQEKTANAMVKGANWFARNGLDELGQEYHDRNWKRLEGI